ncbi:FmhC protein [Clostridium baratii]|uniref:FmhC protein n=1 Tax=Clostridium baratii TaxID=1561 RepID=UPI0030CD00F3
MKFNSERELIQNIAKGNLYKDYILDNIDKFISSDRNTFVDNSETKPSDSFTIQIDHTNYTIGITSMILRQGVTKHFYWLL